MRHLLLSLLAVNACRPNPYIALEVKEGSDQSRIGAEAINAAFGCELVKVGAAESKYHTIKLVVDSAVVLKDYPDTPQIEGWYDAVESLIAIKAFSQCARTKEGHWTGPCLSVGAGEPFGYETNYITALQHELGHAMGLDHVEGTIMQAVNPQYDAAEGGRSLAALYQKTYGVSPCVE